MFIKRTKKKTFCILLQLRCGLFLFTWRVCCWAVAYVWSWIQQWRTDLHNIYGTEQLMVLTLLTYCVEELLSWMLFLIKNKKKRLFTGLYINKIDCAPTYTLFPLLLSCIRWKVTLFYFLMHLLKRLNSMSLPFHIRNEESDAFQDKKKIYIKGQKKTQTHENAFCARLQIRSKKTTNTVSSPQGDDTRHG